MNLCLIISLLSLSISCQILLDTHINADIPQHDTSLEWDQLLSQYYQKPNNKIKKDRSKHQAFKINSFINHKHEKNKVDDTHLLKSAGMGIFDTCSTAVTRLKRGPWSQADTLYFIKQAREWPKNWYHFIDWSYFVRDQLYWWWA